MHITQITSEIAPAAKVGGLADVVLGLSRELLRQGHKIEVILPKYACLKDDEVEEWAHVTSSFSVYLDGSERKTSVWKGLVRGVPVWFIGTPEGYELLDNSSIYGGKDEVLRFLFFSRAALEWIRRQNVTPDVIHCHDWPTAVVPCMVRDLFQNCDLAQSKLMFTMHNVDYQGRCSWEDIQRVGMEGRTYLHPHRMQDNQWKDAVNLMKGGIIYSDAFNTVSPTYASQVQTAPEGRGLEPTVAQQIKKFSGILNGIDYDYWNPANDVYLQDHFDEKQLATGNWAGKKAAKTSLQKLLELPVCDVPLVACISRLVPQKGINLMKHAMYRVKERGGQFVLLGSSTNGDIQQSFEELAANYQQGNHVRFCLKTSERLAHQIFAAADMLLVPSLFEPCGLTQMIALRYAAVPLVRETGGLADTVHDVETSHRPKSERNGFTFTHADNGGVNWVVDRATKMYYETPELWRSLVLTGMRQDHSWGRAARNYLERYQAIINHLPTPIKPQYKFE